MLFAMSFPELEINILVVYTSEDLKWDALQGVIYTIEELKWDILILRWRGISNDLK